MEQPRPPGTAKCRALGHDYDFTAEGTQMTWRCTRCPAGSSKTYPTAAEASRYAAALDRRGSADLGKRAPLVGLLPLRVWRWFRQWRRPPGGPGSSGVA